MWCFRRPSGDLARGSSKIRPRTGGGDVMEAVTLVAGGLSLLRQKEGQLRAKDGKGEHVGLCARKARRSQEINEEGVGLYANVLLSFGGNARVHLLGSRDHFQKTLLCL